ncbi:MAG: DUF3810 domain-containing protein [Oscillospiraceae bacterium]|nr:DUF3810 domain-containing protein [Oscillospiraceae bacterium]
MKYWAGYLTALILGVITWALGQLAERYTVLVDMVYPYVDRTIQDALAAWSGSVEFCLWQLAVLLIIIVAIAALVLIITLHWNPVRLVGWVAAGISLLVLLHTVVYGLNYHAGSIADDIRMDVYDYTVDEMVDAAEYYRDQANALAVRMNRDENGDLVYSEFEALASQAGSGFQSLVRDRSFSVFAGTTLPVKKLGWSKIYTAMGITGITVGLTGEAAVNPDIPAVSIPFTMCHEMAHRMCIATEGDANFAAFLAASANESLEFQYSAYYMAYRYCYLALKNADTYDAVAAADAISAGVCAELQHDLDAYSNFFKKHRDETATRLANTANDTYLKASGDEKGLNSYGSVSDLLVSWHYQEVVLPTMIEEEVVFDPKDEAQVDLTTSQVPPETQEAAGE